MNIIKKLLDKGRQLVRGRAGTKSSIVSPRKGFAETLRGGIRETGAGLRARFGLQTCVFVRTHVVHSTKGLPEYFSPPWPLHPEASPVPAPTLPILPLLYLRVLFELLFALDPVPPLCLPPDSNPSGCLARPLRKHRHQCPFPENYKVGSVPAPLTCRLLRHQPGLQPEAPSHVWGRLMLWTLPGPPAAHTSALEEPKSGLDLGEGFGSGMAHLTLPVSVSSNTPHTEALKQQRFIWHSSGGWKSRSGYQHCGMHLFQACRWLSFCRVLTWQREKASSLVSLLLRVLIPS